MEYLTKIVFLSITTAKDRIIQAQNITEDATPLSSMVVSSGSSAGSAANRKRSINRLNKFLESKKCGKYFFGMSFILYFQLICILRRMLAFEKSLGVLYVT